MIRSGNLSEMNNHPLHLTTFIINFVERRCIGIYNLGIRPAVRNSLISVRHSKLA